jgi:Uma2 family endonuclease
MVSWAQWNALTAEQRNSFAPICPEVVSEVRSAADRLPALREKMESWVANGAELAWLIDPQRKVVEIHRSGEAAEVQEDPASVQGSGCVRGFELAMARVWG